MLDAEYTFGNITAYCDMPKCSTEEEYEGFDGHVDFSGTVDQMKKDGWKIGKKDGDWFHTCPHHEDD